MSNETITPESMKLNDVEPDGFTAEPRVISHEVFKMREQVTALCNAVLQLVDLQREANQKLDEALKGQASEVANAQPQV